MKKWGQLLLFCLYFYNFYFRYNLASTVFPNAKYYVVCTEFSTGSKPPSFQWKINFLQFIIIGEYLKFQEFEYFLH